MGGWGERGKGGNRVCLGKEEREREREPSLLWRLHRSIFLTDTHGFCSEAERKGEGKGRLFPSIYTHGHFCEGVAGVGESPPSPAVYSSSSRVGRSPE